MENPKTRVMEFNYVEVVQHQFPKKKNKGLVINQYQEPRGGVILVVWEGSKR